MSVHVQLKCDSSPSRRLKFPSLCGIHAMLDLKDLHIHPRKSSILTQMSLLHSLCVGDWFT